MAGSEAVYQSSQSCWRNEVANHAAPGRGEPLITSAGSLWEQPGESRGAMRRANKRPPGKVQLLFRHQLQVGGRAMGAAGAGHRALVQLRHGRRLGVVIRFRRQGGLYLLQKCIFAAPQLLGEVTPVEKQALRNRNAKTEDGPKQRQPIVVAPGGRDGKQNGAQRGAKRHGRPGYPVALEQRGDLAARNEVAGVETYGVP